MSFIHYYHLVFWLGLWDIDFGFYAYAVTFSSIPLLRISHSQYIFLNVPSFPFRGYDIDIIAISSFSFPVSFYPLFLTPFSTFLPFMQRLSQNLYHSGLVYITILDY